MKDRLMLQKMEMSISKHMNITYMFISNLITRGNMLYVKMAIQYKKIIIAHGLLQNDSYKTLHRIAPLDMSR